MTPSKFLIFVQINHDNTPITSESMLLSAVIATEYGFFLSAN
ncbi:unknow [Vibrio parahaemolyticus]|nr:unknow [Vibrio parahaemolyticus]